MTNYEMLLKINDKAKENIEKLYNSGKMDLMNKCISYTDDLTDRRGIIYGDKGYLVVENFQVIFW